MTVPRHILFRVPDATLVGPLAPLAGTTRRHRQLPEPLSTVALPPLAVSDRTPEVVPATVLRPS